MTCTVLKPLQGPAGVIPAGSQVDASQWRNREKLIDQRFIAPVTVQTAEASTGTTDKPKSRERKQGGKNA